jgi:hypothetical protein
LGVDEFGFEIFQVSVIEAKLPLQCPVRHALTLAEEVNNLIENRVKVHWHPPAHAEVITDPLRHTLK